MFWREREKEIKEQNGGPPCGQVRVLVVGDSGVGKTSIVHLIEKGSAIARPTQTIGCTVGVKHVTYGNAGSSSSSICGQAERDFFIELWDVSGHDRYKECVIFFHDLTQRRTKASLNKWAAEIAATATFSAPLGSGGPGGLPVPSFVVGNKDDLATKEGGSNGNLVDAAMMWVEKQGLLPSSEELPLIESFPSSSSLCASAKESRFDKEAIMKFFRLLIRRRYFSHDFLVANVWSPAPSQRTLQRLDDDLTDEDPFLRSTSLSTDNYHYNKTLPPQRNLTPPPTLYPQQQVTVSPPENHNFLRHSFSTYSEISSSARSKRGDINV